jgi:predicted nucleic acid-binding protein
LVKEGFLNSEVEIGDVLLTVSGPFAPEADTVKEVRLGSSVVVVLELELEELLEELEELLDELDELLALSDTVSFTAPVAKVAGERSPLRLYLLLL